MKNAMMVVLALASLAQGAEVTLDGILRVEGEPFIRRAGFGGVTTFRKDVFLRLDEHDIGGPRDIYTRSGLNTAMYDFRVEKEGEYDFASLDDFLHRAAKAHLKVVFHIPQSLPRWMAAKRQWHWIGADGSEIPIVKGYPHHNPQEYAAALREVWGPLFDHIRDNPLVIGYQISGEHHPYDSVSSKVPISYDEWTLEKYRAAMKARFSLQEISLRYGEKNDFYTDFSQLYPLALGSRDFKGRELKNPTVARWDWYRFKKLASVDCWAAMAKTFQQMDGRGRSVNYEFNHGPYSDIRYFPMHAAAAAAPGFGLGSGDFEDSLPETFLYNGFVKTIGGAAWINNELETGWTGSFRNDPTSIDAAYLRRHIWGNLAMGSQGYNLWTFCNLANYTPDNPTKLAGMLADPAFGNDLPLKYWEVKYANRQIDSLGKLLANSTAPTADLGILMLDDANFNFMFLESYNVDVAGSVRALMARGLIDRCGIFTDYHLDTPAFDLGKIKALLVPRTPRMTEAHMARLAEYVHQGGTLILMGEVARVGELFREATLFPAGALASAAGIQARKLSAREMPPMESTLSDGTLLRLNSRTEIQEPLGGDVEVLARTSSQKPSMTRHRYGRGQCLYLTGEFIVQGDEDSAADVLTQLLASSGTRPAARLSENSQLAAGVTAARRVGPDGTLLFLIETGDRSHELTIDLDPQVLGLTRPCKVLDTFGGKAYSFTQPWRLSLPLEAGGVRCLLITSAESPEKLFPGGEKPPRSETELLEQGPWDPDRQAQRPYRSDDLMREHRQRLAAESLALTSQQIAWRSLPEGYRVLEMDRCGNAPLATMIRGVELASMAQNQELCPLGRGLVSLGEVPLLSDPKVLKVERCISDLRVDAKVQSLHFFHGGRFSEHNALVGSYRVRYTDGTWELIPVLVQSTISDFVRPMPRPGRCVTIWKGLDSAKTRFELQRFDWINPHPDKKVATLDLLNTSQTQRHPWYLWGLTCKAD